MKKQTKHQLSLPTYLVEKVIMFNTFRNEIGYSAYECSFLLGKHDYFIRDIENLLDKSTLSTIDTNYLLLIFKKNFEEIFPIITYIGNYSITIEECIGLKRKPLFKWQIHNVLDSIRSYSIQEEIKHIQLETTLDLYDKETVTSFIFSLYQKGFFNNTKTALQIFDECRKEENFGSNFHVRNMIHALNFYTDEKSGEPILDNSRTNLFSRRLFYKPINFQINSAKGLVSKAFSSIDITSFQEAA